MRLSSSTNDTILRNIDVNRIVDYFNIPQLMDLARGKIEEILRTAWCTDGFSKVINDALSPQTRDKALRESIASTTAAHIEELSGTEELADLEERSDFEFAIIRQMLARYNSQISQLNQKLNKMEQDFIRARNSFSHAEQMSM